jgi:hypothetical protein
MCSLLGVCGVAVYHANQAYVSVQRVVHCNFEMLTGVNKSPIKPGASNFHIWAS